jgi:hypothetical protein
LGASSEDSDLRKRKDLVSPKGRTGKQENSYEDNAEQCTPGLVAVTIAAAIAFAPAASADTNPLVPYGTNPMGP